MNRRNLALSAVALGAMALVPFTACKKDGGGGAASGSSSDMLSYMPKDATMLVGVSISKATGSALFKSYQEKILENAKDEVAKMKDECGLDPMTDISSLVIGVADVKTPDNALIGVKGKFDQKKIEECITKTGGKVEGTVYTSEDGDKINAYWASGDTVLLSKGMDSAAIKAAAAAGSVKDNKEMMALVGKVDSGAALWVAGMVPAEAGAMMGPMGKPPKSGYLSLKVSSGVDLNVGMNFESEDDAKGLSSMIDMGLAMGKQQEGMKELVEAVKTTQDGSTLTIKAAVSGEQLKKLEGLAGALPI